jgi:hypothetical protein
VAVILPNLGCVVFFSVDEHKAILCAIAIKFSRCHSRSTEKLIPRFPIMLLRATRALEMPNKAKVTFVLLKLAEPNHN